MDNKENKNISISISGSSFFTILGLIFIVLKLCGVINWSWWVVLSPFWGIWLIGMVAMFIGIIVAVVAKYNITK